MTSICHTDQELIRLTRDGDADAGSRYEFSVSKQFLAGATFYLGPAGILEESESYRMNLDKFIDQP